MNFSLDMLNADKFMPVTRCNQLALVMQNTERLIARGFQVKINVVAMKGFNEEEINHFIAWTKDAPVEIRFIEFMPFIGNRWMSYKVLSLQEVLGIAATAYGFNALPGKPHDTAKHFKVPGHKGSFAIISTMTAPSAAPATVCALPPMES